MYIYINRELKTKRIALNQALWPAQASAHSLHVAASIPIPFSQLSGALQGAQYYSPFRTLSIRNSPAH